MEDIDRCRGSPGKVELPATYPSRPKYPQPRRRDLEVDSIVRKDLRVWVVLAGLSMLAATVDAHPNCFCQKALRKLVWPQLPAHVAREQLLAQVTSQVRLPHVLSQLISPHVLPQ